VYRLAEYFNAAKQMKVSTGAIACNVVLQPIIISNALNIDSLEQKLLLGGSSLMLGALGVTAALQINYRVNENTT
jgi:hypothetical protein